MNSSVSTLSLVTMRSGASPAFVLIAEHPSVGARALNASLTGVRRIYLSRIRCHLYYRVRPAPEVVEVLALWHASRGSDPGV